MIMTSQLRFHKPHLQPACLPPAYPYTSANLEVRAPVMRAMEVTATARIAVFAIPWMVVQSGRPGQLELELARSAAVLSSQSATRKGGSQTRNVARRWTRAWHAAHRVIRS